MPSIDLIGVNYAHSDSVALIRDLDLELRPGWTGIVGPNGAGKTTLLDLIRGTLRPDAGIVRAHPASLTLAICAQRVEALEPAIEAFGTRNDGAACRLRGRLGLEVADLARWNQLSPGERKRWQIAAGLGAEPDALLLDEPTNHLDFRARDFLLAGLAGYGGIGIVVSHDRSMLNTLCEWIVRFAHGRVSPYRGGYDVARATWESEQHDERNRQQRVRREQRKLKKRLTERRAQRDHAEARTRTSKRMKNPRDSAARDAFKQSRRRSAVNALGREIEVTHHRIDKLDREASNFRYDKDLGRSLFVDFAAASRATLFRVDEGDIEAGATKLFETPALRVGRTDRIRLYGPNGSGKSTLIEQLLRNASIPPDRYLFLPQDIESRAGRQSLEDARALDRQTRGRLMQIVAALGVDPDALLASECASPGEARKLALAAGLARQVWALVLDEPTNHLDLPSIERLEACLVDYPGALLVVSHDDAFSGRIATTRWQIDSGSLRISAESNRDGSN